MFGAAPSIAKLTPRDDRLASPAIYVLFVIGAQGLFICLLLWVASTNWFMRHNGYPALRQIGYGLSLQHEDCEVVLYGDSSAMTGLDPGVIQRMTGMKTCNVAEGGTITSVVGTYPLDAYLRQNKRPRYLVMMLTPSIFRPSPHWMTSAEPEGYTYLLRFVRGQRLVYTLLRNPKETIKYARWVGERLMDDLWGRLRHTNPDDAARDGGVQRRRTHGLFTFPTPSQTNCVRPANSYKPDSFSGDPSGVAEARAKYGTGGTQVIINVAPVPVCDVLHDTYERILAGEHDNEFERLPISWFNSQDVHFNAAGANYISTEVAQQILKREKQ